LATIAAALRTGEVALAAHIDEICARIEAVEPQIAALLPEPDRRGRLLREAAALEARYSDPATRPALYGVLAGVKDIIHVEGFVTRAGSTVPPELFAGSEADCVRLLRDAGALILGKTVTTEFAGAAPNGTRNPHDPAHTPGGSSSGSAAGVAAGYCPLALGTQTVGSVIRPAAFCGVAGFKPTYARIPTGGIVYYSPSADTIGLFTQDIAGMALAAAALCRDWRPAAPDRLPVLALPEGAYLRQASAAGLDALARQVDVLQRVGYQVERVPALDDIDAIAERHYRLVRAEAAAVHRDWYDTHAASYRPQSVEVIEAGRAVTPRQLADARLSRSNVRQQLEGLMDARGIDLWICPPAPGPAPEGIESTGSPAMNLPWTHAGLPAVTVPAGRTESGLPLGLQLVARANADEALLAWAAPITDALAALTDA
jgi:Asp-tRNA(Asn)/Glu-tRNA(Gln) amidotransferase A subunit family amidase